MSSLQSAYPQANWLARCLSARDADELRTDLRRYNADLVPDALTTLAIVGLASEGRRLADICRLRGIRIAAVVDDDPAKVGTTFGEVTVQPLATLHGLPRSTVVVIASHRVLQATQRLRALGFKYVVPFAALQVLAPHLFPPHMFYRGLLEDLVDHKASYAELNERLADARSRDVLDAVLGFRQTFDPLLLEPVVEGGLYQPAGLFEFAADETYVDAGSFDGDTVRSFIGRVDGRFDRIYAFEPDPVTFAKLTANFGTEPRVHTVHAGTYSHKGQLRFRDDASRGAIFAEDGGAEMPVTTIDGTLEGRRATYIKMNIEGAEIEALKGAQRTIATWLPRLAISVYHRPGDLWQIPRLIGELGSGYRFYLRQHDGGIIETVLYAIARSARQA